MHPSSADRPPMHKNPLKPHKESATSLRESILVVDFGLVSSDDVNHAQDWVRHGSSSYWLLQLAASLRQLEVLV